jgi:hypothetical protein
MMETAPLTSSSADFEDMITQFAIGFGRLPH